MPTYETAWFIPDHVLTVTTVGTPTLDEIHTQSTYVDQLMTASSAPLVHIIVDSTQLENFEYNVEDIVKAQPHLKNAKLGWTLVIQPNHTLFNTVSNFTHQLNRSRRVSVRTLDEAVAFLVEHNPLVAELLNNGE